MSNSEAELRERVEIEVVNGEPVIEVDGLKLELKTYYSGELNGDSWTVEGDERDVEKQRVGDGTLWRMVGPVNFIPDVIIEPRVIQDAE